MTRERPVVAFVWNRFAPYHHDRCRAVADALVGTVEVLGVEIADRSDTYAWESSPAGYRHVTLFPGRTVERLGRLARLRALWAALWRARAEAVFLCHYERPETAALAWMLRLRRCRVFVLFDSKFDDKPRRLWREWSKARMLAPYHGALASGRRARAYLSFLGLRPEWIALGYDSISVARLRRDADSPPAPDGAAHGDRAFVVVARFVSKKNLETALAAYGAYRAAAEVSGERPRDLVLCGDGPERAALDAFVRARGLEGVQFTGFRQPAEVARLLAGALALLLPSVEEQWGLVVNEALALGVPVLASTQVGAADGLLRAGVNGYLFDPFEVEGMAVEMLRLTNDRAHWAALAAGARDSAWTGDAARFAEGVAALLERP